MSIRFSLLAVVAVIVMGEFTGKADAQAVVVTGTGYAANNPPAQPSTIAPYGTFSVPMNMAGTYQVNVVYGTMVNGSFSPYNPVPQGIPGSTSSTPVNVGANGADNVNWNIPAANASGISKGDIMQATLQVSQDGGKTWTTVGNTTLVTALPTPPPKKIQNCTCPPCPCGS
jgi:hypothetical protein